MVSKSDGLVVLWPAYFDRSRSRSEGRRVARDKAVERPDVKQVAKAAKAAGLTAEVDADARHPSRPWEASGRVLVADADAPKEALLDRVADELAKAAGGGD